MGLGLRERLKFLGDTRDLWIKQALNSELEVGRHYLGLWARKVSLRE